ncbi:MAG: hypothetical protein RID09_19880 [Coleofasciculus sp. G1-WW12-02]|uniref:hypothetical protein n=1 Tax=Coleofasciculus sp. G1-WW12-02 TaxID=3068483 RepID=UPI0032FC9DC6
MITISIGSSIRRGARRAPMMSACAHDVGGCRHGVSFVYPGEKRSRLGYLQFTPIIWINHGLRSSRLLPWGFLGVTSSMRSRLGYFKCTWVIWIDHDFHRFIHS